MYAEEGARGQVDHFCPPLGVQLLGNEVEVKPVNFSRPQTHSLPLSETCTPSHPSPPRSLTPSPPPTNPYSTTPQQTPTNVEALTPTPPPTAEPIPPTPVLLPDKPTDVLSASLPRPVAQPTTVTPPSRKVGSSPSSLTPSPDLPETPLHQQARLKDQYTEMNGTLNTSQQSGSGFESPQASFPPPTSSPSTVEPQPSHSVAVDEPSKQAPLRPLSGGSTGSRESLRIKPTTSHRGTYTHMLTHFDIHVHVHVD